MRPTSYVVTVALCCAAVGTQPAAARPDSKPECRVTVTTRVVRPDVQGGPEAFNFGGPRLRAHLYWPGGRLAAGILPDGGSMATVEDDGSIHTKVGWWRGVPGRLRVTGRRLDAAAPPLRASVPGGYGPRGFQPTGLVFPTVGCWRVVGQVGDARLTFVVRVTKLRWH
jgi:hypothetical protein